MEIRLQRWGNSSGIRIPKNILNSLGIKDNDQLNIEQVEDKIVITVPKKEKIDLDKLFEEYHGQNLAKDFIWDESRGREIW